MSIRLFSFCFFFLIFKTDLHVSDLSSVKQLLFIYMYNQWNRDTNLFKISRDKITKLIAGVGLQNVCEMNERSL